MIVGISTVKDESDIIGPVVEHMLTQVDHVLIADNLSTDGTYEILENYTHPGSLTLLLDEEVAYYQSRRMSRLAAMAADDFKAEWVVPFDADEIWNSTTYPTIRDHLNALPADISICMAELHDHVASGLDPADDNPITRIRYRRKAPAELVKVAARPVARVVIEQGNHSAHYPSARAGDLSICHYPYRSVQQFESKVRNGAAAYAATDLPESRGAHWRQYGRILDTFGPEAVHEIFREWFFVQDPANDPIYTLCP